MLDSTQPASAPPTVNVIQPTLPQNAAADAAQPAAAAAEPAAAAPQPAAAAHLTASNAQSQAPLRLPLATMKLFEKVEEKVHASPIFYNNLVHTFYIKQRLCLSRLFISRVNV